MIFWAVVGGLTALAIGLLVRPLFRAPGESAPAAAEYDLTVYRDQLTELERDRARGILTEDQAEAARVEVERRILKVSEQVPDRKPPSSGAASARAAAIVMMIFVPALALVTYFQLGAPGTPSVPFSERAPVADSATSSLDDVIAQLRNRLDSTPEDPQAWVLLGRALAETGDLPAAETAFRSALQHAPDDLTAKGWLAETLVARNDGAVVPQSRELFAQILVADPDNPLARYYGGLAMIQDGELQPGLAVWHDLFNDAGAGSPWQGLIRQEIAQLAATIGADAAELMPPEPAAGDVAGGNRGPSAADVEAAAEMTEEERAAFIRSMVEQLAARLEQDPSDLAGWLRLARAYQVLGEGEKARAALERGDRAAADLPADSPEKLAIRQALEALPPGD